MNNDFECTIEDLLEHRLRLYDLLRRIFLWEITPELFSELVGAANQEPSLEIGDCAPEAALKNSLKGVMASELTDRYRDIEIEYTRLFVGPRHLPAPPYESVYRSPQRLMMQDVTMQVRSFYRRNGFEVNRLNQEPDDTIGIELEFMCALSSASVVAHKAKDIKKLSGLFATQRDFCKLHLFQWVPQFCEDIIVNTQSHFWKGAAQCTRSFIEQELTELDRLCEHSNSLAG